MGRSEKTRQIILKLKEVQEGKNLSIPQIHELVNRNGGNTSLSSVRRVFAEGSEDQGFRYEDTIQPIANVLLAVDESIEPPASGADAAELEALRTLVRLKNSIITEMESEIANVRADKDAIRAESQAKIDYLKEQASFKDEQLRKKDSQLDERRDFIYRKDRIITILAIALAVCLFIIVGALVADKINPSIGFFWLEDAAAFIRNGLQSKGLVAAYGLKI